MLIQWYDSFIKDYGMKRIEATEVICSLLILLFAYTALSKFFSTDRFQAVLEQSPIISSGAGMLAWQVPLTELCIALLLFFPVTRLTGLWASLVLLLLFSLYLVYMLVFAVHLPCHCGGVIGSMSWEQHLFFNAFFIGITMTGIRKCKKQLNGSVVENYG